MTVKLIAHLIKRFQGLSTDVKPVNDVPVGSYFLELDKGKEYEFDGTNWNLITKLTTLYGSNAGASEVLTVDNTVGGKGFTAAKIVGMTKAFVSCETAQIRFTLDGTAPTTTVGHLLEIGDMLKLDSAADLASFRAIRTGAVSASLQCTFSS